MHSHCTSNKQATFAAALISSDGLAMMMNGWLT